MDKFLIWLNETPENFFIFLTAVILLVSSAATVVINLLNTRIGKISKLNKEIDTLKSKNMELTSKIAELNDLEKTDNEMMLASDGDYLLWKGKNIKVCPACWYHDKRISPIPTGSMDGSYTCSRCNHTGILDNNRHNLMMVYMTEMLKKQNKQQKL